MKARKRHTKEKFIVGILLVAFLASALSGCIDQTTEEGLEIVIVGRDSASGTREFFFEEVMEEEEFADTMLEKNSNGAVKTTVAQTPGAIGFVGLGYVDSTVKALVIEGVEATVDNVFAGTYPIARDLNMFTDGEATGIAAEFLAYIDSDEGQEIVADEGFVPKQSTGPYAINSAITSGTLSIAGSTTVLPIAELAAESFEQLYPDVDVVVSSGGSSVGVQSAGSGSADIGMASREMKDSEKSDYPDLVKHVVCGDGIAIIVHPDNDNVDALNLEQVKGIYKGTYDTWEEVNPPEGLTVVLIGRDSASGTREFFFEAVMEEEEFAATILEKNSNGAVKTTVEQTPGAVGFVGMGYLDSSIKALEVGGVEATVANVLSGDYPIARDLNMFTDGEPTGIAAEFLAYIDSDEGQEIVADEGFVPKDSTGAYEINSAITSGTLSIAGSTTVLPIAELAAESFEQLYPDVDVVVSSGGSSVGVQSAGSGSADIGMASRELKSSEQSDYPDLVKHIVCGDGIAIIVHAQNTYIDSITMEQIKSLFKGEIENWNEF